MTVQSSRRSDQRDRLADAAARLFARQGYAATAVGDIAAAVGITGGGVYRHFESKEQILETIVDGILSEYCAAARAVAAGGEDAVVALVSRTVDLTLSRPEFAATYLRERHRLPSPVARFVRKQEREVWKLWSDVLLGTIPSMTPTDVAIRQRAANGVLAALARRGSGPRPRLDSLIVGGLCSALLLPVPTPRSAGAAPTGWLRPNTRRELIRDAAVELFCRSGYHGTGIDQIGEAAGIAGPTVYGTFGSKAEILVDIYDQTMARISICTDQALRLCRSGDEALARAVRAYVEVAFDSTDMMLVVGREARSLPTADRVRMDRWARDYRLFWGDLLLEARNDLTPAEAQTITSIAFGLMQRVALRQREGRPGIDETVDLALAFLLASPRTPMR